MKLTILMMLSLAKMTLSCDFKPWSAKETGIVCRVTKPAALLLNQQTTRVIQAAFRHASYPAIKAEKSMRFLGKVSYSLDNLQINDLSIGNSEVELKEHESVAISIQNVSVSFKGTLSYGYGSWLVNLGHSIDFEIESETDLLVNTKLTCGGGLVVADTSDCYLSFHKLVLHLQGDKQPGWLKQIFTDFVSFTLKFVIKSQICKEINYVANLLAAFIQDKAEQFLRDGDIGVDISLTSLPVLKADYIESQHKGLLQYKQHQAFFNQSIFSPSMLAISKMLYFWISDQVINSLALAAYLEKRWEAHISADELKGMFQNGGNEIHPSFLHEILPSISLQDTVVKVWSVSPPVILFKPEGTVVKASVAVEINTLVNHQESTVLYFETDVNATVLASYAEKKLFLQASAESIHIRDVNSTSETALDKASVHSHLEKIISVVGIPYVVSNLEPALTMLMDRRGLKLFDIINPEIITQEGYVIVQLDFGFPHHLLVDFLKKTLQK